LSSPQPFPGWLPSWSQGSLPLPLPPLPPLPLPPLPLPLPPLPLPPLPLPLPLPPLPPPCGGGVPVGCVTGGGFGFGLCFGGVVVTEASWRVAALVSGSVGLEAGPVAAAGRVGTVTVGPGFGFRTGLGFGLGAGDEDGTGADVGLGSATGVGAEIGAGRVTGTGREINCVLPLVETDDECVDGLVETRFRAFACFAACPTTSAREAASGGRRIVSLSGARAAGFWVALGRCENGRAGAGAAAVTEIECAGCVGGRVVR
jgi:hypothetical protein